MQQSNSVGQIGSALLAIFTSLAVFSCFLIIVGAAPSEVFKYMFQGSFGSAFSIQNTLLMSVPLLLVAFCTALPAKLGMVVIGGEGTIAVGGLAAALGGGWLLDYGYLITFASMFLSAFIAGGIWMSLVGILRYYKGANETIVSLLLNYIAIAILNHFVEGPLRDPASLNKPSTIHIGQEKMLGFLPGTDVHYGILFGVAFSLIMYFIYHKTSFGFGVRVAGGNPKAALLAGLSLKNIILITFFLAGGISGIAGMVEVAAIHGRANASLVAGYGYTGILVSFLARHHPLAIIPVTILFGALNASNGLIQRRCELPDATMFVLQGIIFVFIIGWDGFSGVLYFGTIKNLKFKKYGFRDLAHSFSNYRRSYKG